MKMSANFHQKKKLIYYFNFMLATKKFLITSDILKITFQTNISVFEYKVLDTSIFFFESQQLECICISVYQQ